MPLPACCNGVFYLSGWKLDPLQAADSIISSLLLQMLTSFMFVLSKLSSPHRQLIHALFTAHSRPVSCVVSPRAAPAGFHRNIEFTQSLLEFFLSCWRNSSPNNHDVLLVWSRPHVVRNSVMFLWSTKGEYFGQYQVVAKSCQATEKDKKYTMIYH